MSSASIVNNIAVQLYRYVPIPLFMFGCIGNIFNVLVFRRPVLVKTPCSIYFLCLSIINLSVLFFGLFSRFLSQGFGIDPSSYNLGLCRLRYFIVHCSMVLSSWFIVLAGIDRYCISSRNARRRQLSNLKYARYLSALTIIIVLVLYSHVFGLFTIEQLTTGPYCYAQAGAYRIFYDFFYFATYSFIPPIVMITVGVAIFYNVQHARSQVGPTATNNTNVSQLKRKDRQLIRMLLAQVIFAVFLTLPIAIEKLYSTFTQNALKDSYRIAMENLITQIVRMLAFTNSCTSFYVFTLSGSLYRKEFLRIITKMIGSIFGKNNSMYRQFQALTEVRTNVQSISMNQTIPQHNNT